MNPNQFFGELRRRNVYKVAVAYAVVGCVTDSGRHSGFSVFGNSKLGCSPGLRDDSPYKNLLAKVDLPTAS
jgi:hypothetical protein